MILNWPDHLIIKSVDIINNVSAVSSESRNKKILNRTLSGQRFDLNMRIDIAPWNTKKASGFLFSLQDDDVFVEYTDVDWIGTASNTTSVGGANKGARDIELASVTNLNAGDWVNFGGHDKLYKILYLVGNTITVNTNLLETVSNGEVVELENPKILLELAPDLKQSTTFSSRLHRDLSRFNLRMVEAL